MSLASADCFRSDFKRRLRTEAILTKRHSTLSRALRRKASSQCPSWGHVTCPRDPPTTNPLPTYPPVPISPGSAKLGRLSRRSRHVSLCLWARRKICLLNLQPDARSELVRPDH